MLLHYSVMVLLGNLSRDANNDVILLCVVMVVIVRNHLLNKTLTILLRISFGAQL